MTDIAETVKRIRSAWLPVILASDIHEVLAEFERVTGERDALAFQLGDVLQNAVEAMGVQEKFCKEQAACITSLERELTVAHKAMLDAATRLSEPDCGRNTDARHILLGALAGKRAHSPAAKEAE